MTKKFGLAERFIASPWAGWSQVDPLSSVHDANYPLVCSSWYSTLERDGEKGGRRDQGRRGKEKREEEGEKREKEGREQRRSRENNIKHALQWNHT